MGKTRETGFLRNILANDGSALTGYVPNARTLTINGTTQDLSTNRTFNIATSATLGGLTDATISSLVDNQLLRYNAATSKWVNWTPNYLTGITSSQVTTALGYTPVTNARTITINGTSYDLSADRSWTIAGGVTSFNTRTGAITLSSGDVTSALGFTPYNSSNPSGYITGITSSMVTSALGYTPYNSSNPSGYLSGTIGIANGGTGATSRKAASSRIANFGQLEDHGTYVDANAIQQWGGTFLQAATNGHGFNGSTQYYQMMLSLGANYDWGSGNVYACQIAISRNVSTPYIGIRYKEGGGDTAGWGGWQKIAAGYADSAGTLSGGANVSNSNGPALTVTKSGSAPGNNVAFRVVNSYGNHSWGITGEFRVEANGGTDRPSILFSNGYDSNTWTIGYGYADSGYFRINRDHGYVNGTWGTTLMSMDRSGNVTFSGDVTAYSDVRLKENITVIDNAIEKINKIRGVTFTRIDDIEKNVGRRHAGVIAQEVLQVLPEVVSLDDKGNYYNVSYGSMAGLFIEGIKEHDKIIKEQQDQIKELKQRINELTK